MSPLRVVRVIAIVAAAGLAAQPGFSQRGGATAPPAAGTGGGATAGTGSTGTVTSPGKTSIPNSPTTPNTTPQPNTLPQPIFLSGRVLLEDGTPPSESVTIERVCSGSPRAEGYTDSKGYFGIQLGQGNNMVIQDASETSGFGGLGNGGGGGYAGGMGSSAGGSTQGMAGSGGTSELRYANCDLRAKLSGYRSQLVSLAGHRALDNPDIGIILLHRLSPTEGSTISAVSLAAPKDARKAFDKGVDSLKKKKPEDALKSFQKAVDVYPDYAAAWYELGRIQAGAGALDTARISFECSVKADPKYVAPYVDLAAMAIQAKKWPEVANLTDRAIKLDVFDYPEVYFFNAVAHYNLKNFDTAEKSARQAEKLDTRHHFPQNLYLLGVLLAHRQEYAGAVDELREYLKLAPTASDAPAAKTQLERLEKVTASGGPPVPKQDQ